MALNSLPVELHWNIARFFDADEDVVNYALTCREMYAAIEESSKNFWRQLFLKLYDPPNTPVSADVLRSKYQSRAMLLKKNQTKPFFGDGGSAHEIIALTHLRELIKEAKSNRPAVRGKQEPESRNMERLKVVVRQTNILSNIGSPQSPTHPRSLLLQAVQVVLAPFFLDPHNYFQYRGFAAAQRAAYASARAEPIFYGPDNLKVNLPWLLNVINFFKGHLLHRDFHTVADAYRVALESQNWPHTWREPLKLGSFKLGNCWKGTYAYLEREEIPLIRRLSVDQIAARRFVDMNIINGFEAIQNMHIAFPEEFKNAWPAMFERHLNAVPVRAPPVSQRTTRAQHRDGRVIEHEAMFAEIVGQPNYRFIGNGYDDEDFIGQGWLNPLPSQQGIPGWQRMSMMKYFEDPDTGNLDGDALWAYEGVVLPGGKIIVGRWWSPDARVPADEIYSGPFIFWNTDVTVGSCCPIDDPSAPSSC